MSASPETLGPRDLDPMIRELLEFERSWRAADGSKPRRIRERFHISMTRYQQLLGRAIDRPEALAFDPMLVRRLRRLREDRRRRRVAARLGSPPTPG